ncbi:MAG: serine hydrolase [Clostridia bacterium]|nr:serine hydrolase [Clostridia bacterium]
MGKRTVVFVLIIALLQTAWVFPARAAGSYRAHGDVDGNGKTEAADARLALRASVGLETLDSTARLAAEVTGDDRLEAADARLILRAAVDLESVPLLHRFTQTDPANKNGKPERHYICDCCGFDAQPAPASLPVAQAEQATAVCKKYGAVSAQAAVIKNGVVTNCFVYGKADKSTGRAANEDTKYRIASLSKLIVCLVFLCLQDRGLVHENDDISDYFGYKCRNPRYPGVVITPSMLMSHTASFVNVGKRMLEDGDLASYGFYLNVKPGTQYNYSDIGIMVLACLCERASGKYLNQLAKEYLFDPLGIDASFLASELRDTSNLGVLYGEEGGWNVSQQLGMASKPLGRSLNLAMGNLTISAKDYARIIALLLNDGKTPSGKAVLSANAVSAVKKQRTSMPKYGVGYGTQIETTVIKGKTVYVHTGSAYGMYSTYVFCPADQCGVVVLTSGCARRLEPESEVYYVCLELIRTVYPG